MLFKSGTARWRRGRTRRSRRRRRRRRLGPIYSNYVTETQFVKYQATPSSSGDEGHF
jgi:hypothetical protein